MPSGGLEPPGVPPETPLEGGSPLRAATADGAPDEETERPPPGETWLEALSRLPAGPWPSSMSVSSATTSFELP